MSNTEEPAIRLLDLNAHRLVITLSAGGRMDTFLRRMCPSAAADLLRGIADQLDEQHPAFPCHWDERRDEPAPAVEPDEPTVAREGSLDDERRVWTDGTGHRWDLSVPWDDVTGTRWQWTGRVDRKGAPLMRSADGVETEPLDVIRAITGPIAPAVGEGR